MQLLLLPRQPSESKVDALAGVGARASAELGCVAYGVVERVRSTDVIWLLPAPEDQVDSCCV